MGLVGGTPRVYAGPGIGTASSWKCPRCGVDQVGDPTTGCTSCGAGTAKAYRAPTTEIATAVTPATSGDKSVASVATPALDLAARWVERHPEATLMEAFIAGVQAAVGLERSAATAPDLLPARKRNRTITAALRLFRDQVLREAAEEIASGEWGSIDEVNRWIDELDKEI